MAAHRRQAMLGKIALPSRQGKQALLAQRHASEGKQTRRPRLRTPRVTAADNRPVEGTATTEPCLSIHGSAKSRPTMHQPWGAAPRQQSCAQRRATHNNRHTCGACRAKRYLARLTRPVRRQKGHTTRRQTQHAKVTSPTTTNCKVTAWQPQKPRQVATTRGSKQGHPWRTAANAPLHNTTGN